LSGRVEGRALSLPTSLELVETYASMLTIRRFEERAPALRRRDEIAGSIHLCAGQEAIAVGALAALEPHDRVVSTYRGHGWTIACGAPLDALMAELCQRATGRATGCSASAAAGWPIASPGTSCMSSAVTGGSLPLAHLRTAMSMALRQLPTPLSERLSRTILSGRIARP
jgi:2-oxoisovalerate dehydrogenase E1 component